MNKIDAHVHMTSFLFQNNFENPAEGDCVKAILGLMDKYGIDQCLSLGDVFSTPEENAHHINIAKALPDRIAGITLGFIPPMPKPWTFDAQAAADEMEGYLKEDVVKGFGELALARLCDLSLTWGEVLAKLRPTLEVVSAHKALISVHTGMFPQFFMAGQGRVQSQGAIHFSNPALVDDIATEYPEIPILLAHAGVQGFFYFGSWADMALTVAARNPNVYIETSSVPYEVLIKAVECPAIGPEKLIFGTDTPAFYQYYKAPSTGEYYPSYGKTGPGPETADHYFVDLENIDRLPITSEQKDMILGGTVARILAEKI